MWLCCVFWTDLEGYHAKVHRFLWVFALRIAWVRCQRWHCPVLWTGTRRGGMGWLLDLNGWLVYHTSDLGTAALLILFSSTTSGPKAGVAWIQDIWHRYGYGSIPINTFFRGMNIHLPAILMFTRGTRFWHTAKCSIHGSWILIRMIVHPWYRL